MLRNRARHRLPRLDSRASPGSGGHARVRSTSRSFELLLGAIEETVLLGKLEPGEVLSLLLGITLCAFYALDEASCHRTQRKLRVDVEAPRDVDCGKEDVAHLLEHMRMRLCLRRRLASLRQSFLQLTKLVVEIRECGLCVRILEVDGSRTPLHLPREEQRR